jgi:hypothetical protein
LQVEAQEITMVVPIAGGQVVAAMVGGTTMAITLGQHVIRQLLEQ